MADPADRADVECESRLNGALQLRRRVMPLPPVGACYWCGSDIARDLRFCGPGCRDDFDRERASLARAGRDR